MAKASKKRNSLAYVRQERKLSKSSVASELNTSADRITSFEAGERDPSARQYSILQGIYGVPDYLLAGDSPPNLEPLPVDFRKEHLAPIETSPKGLRAYFARMDTAAALAYVGDVVGEKSEVKLPEVLNIDALVAQAQPILDRLGLSPSDSMPTENSSFALRKMRYAVERAGLFTFLVDVPQEDYRGVFTLINESWGLCLVNKRTFKDKARLFTIAHELGHFVSSNQGVSDPFVLRNDIEKACNTFASHFLAPPDYFDGLARDAFARYRSIDERIRFVSQRCLLSFGATAYRLRENGLISQKELSEWYARNNVPQNYGGEDSPDDEDGSVDGGHYAYNVISDFGYRPLLFLQEALKKGNLDEADIGRLTNARGKTQDKMFQTLNDRIEEFGY